MTNEKTKRLGAILGIIILVIVACFVGRKMVNAITPQVRTADSSQLTIESSVR